MDLFEFYTYLNGYLEKAYETKSVAGGHDWLHVRDVKAMGRRITYLPFDVEEFHVAAILHNTDRSETLKPEIEDFGGLEKYLHYLLEKSPFDSVARNRIVFAVTNHSKKELPSQSPALAIALQDADKLVRFRPSNLLYAGAHGGHMGVPAYLSGSNPFGYTSTREKDRTSMWMGFLGNLEWIAMLSCDEARELLDREYLALFLNYLRAFGREIAEHDGCENASEADIKKALGDYYDWALDWARLKTLQSAGIGNGQ